MKTVLCILVYVAIVVLAVVFATVLPFVVCALAIILAVILPIVVVWAAVFYPLTREGREKIAELADID